VKLLSNLGVDIELFEIVSSGVSNSLDHYDSHKGQWDIPWDLLRIELQKIVRDDLAGIFPKRDVPARMTTVHIDELDLKILEFTYKKDISVAKIRKRFKIGQEKARSHLNKLRTSGLITVNWHVHQIGLNESIIVATSDEHIGLSIAAWSQRLPYSVVSYVSDNSVFLRAELPSGGSHGLSAAVRTIDPTATVNLIDKPIRGPWTFPFELWDVKKQMWKCPEKKLSDWLLSIS
jgi:DNA-binding Lrp family transcriptional regulator